MVAAIANVTATFVSAPIRPLVSASASAATRIQTGAQNTASQAVHFGPATQVQLSPQAQSLIAANGNSVATTQPTISQAALALTYKTTATQAWAQALNSLGLTQQQLDALPLTQRITTEAKAVLLAETLVTQQVRIPSGVSQSQATNSIAIAVNAVAG